MESPTVIPETMKNIFLLFMIHILFVYTAAEQEFHDSFIFRISEYQQECARDGDGGEHGNKNTDTERQCEPFDQTGAEPEQNDGSNDT